MITVHPSVLIVPPRDRVAMWADSIADIPLVRMYDAALQFSFTALARAYEADQVPTLRALVEIIDPTVTDPLSLMTIVHALIQELSWVEEAHLPDSSDIAYVPDDVRKSAGPCAAQLADLVVASATDSVAFALYGGGIPDGDYVLRRAESGVASGPSELHFRILSSARTWYALVDPESAPDAASGVKAALARHCTSGCYRSHAGLTVIHGRFEASTGYVLPNLRGLVLGRAAYLIHSGFLQHTRSLRVSGSAAAPAHVSARHGGIARRAHVTKHHEGYRLHAWLLEDGRVELASAEPKSYVGIPD
jgi:hypothetical protein